MQRHLIRDIFVALVMVWGLINIFPTIGWMTLSEQERLTRIARWHEEDQVYREPSLIADTSRVIRRWTEFDQSRVITLGLDLQGGIHMVLGLDTDKLDPKRKQEYIDRGYNPENIREELQSIAVQRIERRVAEFEAQEPVIQALGTGQIQVLLPGEKDVQRAKNLIMKTAFLTFHTVTGSEQTVKVFRAIEEKFPGRFFPYLKNKFGRGSVAFETPVENIEKVRSIVDEAKKVPGLIPDDKMIAFSPPPNPTDDQVHLVYLLDKAPLISGEGLRLAVAREDPESVSGGYQILFENSPESAKDFGEVTQANLQRSMAIVLDDVVVSAPTIQSKITESGRITGSFTRDQAADLAIALNSGSMPVPITEDFTGVVGASLGSDSIRKGVWSSIIGIGAVVVFMVIYYHVGGIIANIGLIANTILLLAALSYFNATLTLPGIAGLVLTMGMAVDANVLIYERVREELRIGKSLAAAIDSGYSRASVTIIDSNLTTLIAAAVLMEFGTGPVEGFAVTLTVGIITSVFSSLVLTKAVFDLVLRNKWLTNLTMLSIFKPDTKVPFMANRKFAYAFSVIITVIGLAVIGLRGQNYYGVDFRTGTNMQVHLASEAKVDEEAVRTTLNNAGFSDANVQAHGEETLSQNRFLIRLGDMSYTTTSTGETADTTISTRVQNALAPLCGAEGKPEQVELENVQTVGPSVGRQLKVDTVWAVVYSLVFIYFYMWYRFDWRYAAGAIVATAHDVAVCFGMLALTGREVSLTVIAAILTVIGYSLNDTVVVFDRIRENQRLYRGRGMTTEQIMNASINQTLSRTLLTSICTLFVVVVLYFYGGEVLNDFAFVLMVGIIIGTYSSIFVASPITNFLITLHDKRKGGSKDVAADGRQGRRRRQSSRSQTNEAAV